MDEMRSHVHTYVHTYLGDEISGLWYLALARARGEGWTTGTGEGGVGGFTSQWVDMASDL